ncbi:hypothetical protein B0H17DRAFT_1133845 [Mycena rosella]|uniref:Uncharacterized protein n=1 Tax=Mycena rosella TaxID=1033263 RepID=A0AAD7DHE7_MYCRO|nr:hypothetical protein B0H17DRAFT_1133845 [Mycena rosella]
MPSLVLSNKFRNARGIFYAYGKSSSGVSALSDPRSPRGCLDSRELARLELSSEVTGSRPNGVLVTCRILDDLAMRPARCWCPSQGDSTNVTARRRLLNLVLHPEHFIRNKVWCKKKRKARTMLPGVRAIPPTMAQYQRCCEIGASHGDAQYSPASLPNASDGIRLSACACVGRRKNALRKIQDMFGGGGGSWHRDGNFKLGGTGRKKNGHNGLTAEQKAK